MLLPTALKSNLEPTPHGRFILACFNYTVPQSNWVVKLGPNGEYCGTAPCLDSLLVSSITPPIFEGGQGGATRTARHRLSQSSTCWQRYGTNYLLSAPAVALWGVGVVQCARAKSAV
ncbi:hypothetical protein C7N43_22945 [Sphingobacteriales bacterium UPWRP_1]|nr:hypothetical protein B6N25_15000 [Sphingobacteriales bacterium TSM_CSS]PSJ74650.1 hypothetical protein C7N43_22945 [Sphingobacteriales bacterium UPWRP_1]